MFYEFIIFFIFALVTFNENIINTKSYSEITGFSLVTHDLINWSHLFKINK